MAGEAVPCAVGAQCKNSPEHAGEEHTQCHWCCLSPPNMALPDECGGGGQKSCWRPLVKGTRHPILEERRRVAKRQQMRKRALSRANRDKGKQKLLRQAKRAEVQTERHIIAATHNSGRSRMDGDHLAAGGRITLDTKLQTERDHPVVNMFELWKVNQDAVRAGAVFGALVLRPKSNQGVVVLRERDFAKLLERLGLEGSSNEPE